MVFMQVTNMKTLKEHIAQNYASQADFARHLGVYKSQITQWLQQGVIIVDGRLYTPVRHKDKNK